MPSLAHAIRKNSVSLAQVQNNYKLNVLAVNTVMTGITRVNFPPPSTSIHLIGLSSIMLIRLLNQRHMNGPTTL